MVEFVDSWEESMRLDVHFAGGAFPRFTSISMGRSGESWPVGEDYPI